MEIYPSKAGEWAYEQNPKAVKNWLDEEQPAIQQKTKKENAEIRWGGETCLCNNSCHGRNYAPRGKTTAISLLARCKRVNLISTITNQGKARFMIYSDRMNADTFTKFIKRLINGADLKILLILDNLRVHHSYKARDWLVEQTDQPHLKPGEYLNCYLKPGVHSGTSAKTK